MVVSSREKAFCELEYARTNSNKTMPRAFAGVLQKIINNNGNLDSAKNLKTKAFCSEQKDLGRPATYKDKVEQVCQKLLRSPKKFIRRTNLEN